MLRPQTIFMVSHNYTPYSGGVVSSINAISDELRSRGHTVKIITLDYAGDYHDHADVIRLYCPLKLSYGDKPIAVPFFVKQQLRQLINDYQPDIIHVHHPFFLSAAAQKIAQEYRIPVIFTFHTMYDQNAHYVPLPQPLAEHLIQTVVKRFCEQVDHIIAPSARVKKLLQEQEVLTPIAVLPSPLLPYFFHKKCPQKSLSKTINLLCVSRFEKEKNLYELLKFFSLLDERYILTLAGFGALEDDLKRYAFEELRIVQTRLTFTIRPAHKELIELYKKAHFFVFTSQSETQGLVIAEALAGGVPVIALEVAGAEDIIINGYNGFLVNDIYAMKGKLTSLVQSQELYQQTYENAWRSADALQARAIIDQLEFVYAKYL